MDDVRDSPVVLRLAFRARSGCLLCILTMPDPVYFNHARPCVQPCRTLCSTMPDPVYFNHAGPCVQPCRTLCSTMMDPVYLNHAGHCVFQPCRTLCISTMPDPDGPRSTEEDNNDQPPLHRNSAGKSYEFASCHTLFGVQYNTFQECPKATAATNYCVDTSGEHFENPENFIDVSFCSRMTVSPFGLLDFPTTHIKIQT